MMLRVYFGLARSPVFVVARLLRRADQVPDTLERQDTDALGLGGVLSVPIWDGYSLPLHAPRAGAMARSARAPAPYTPGNPITLGKRVTDRVGNAWAARDVSMIQLVYVPDVCPGSRRDDARGGKA